MPSSFDLFAMAKQALNPEEIKLIPLEDSYSYFWVWGS